MRIAHIADLHLDSVFTGMPLEKAKTRKADIQKAFYNCVNKAAEYGAEIMLICGDLFENEYASFKTAELLSSVMQKSNIRFFITPGNHDYYSENSIYHKFLWPDNVYIFKNGIQKVSYKEADIYGFGQTQPFVYDRLLADFKVEDEDRINIMALHAMLVSENAKSEYLPISKSEIEKTGLDYLALGHIHKYSEIQYANKTAYAYSGCIEGRGFDELMERGMILADINKEKSEFEFAATNQRRYLIEDVDVSDCVNMFDIINKVENSLSKYSNTDIVRIRLVGQTNLKNIDINMLLELATDAFYYEVKDETELFKDLYQQANDKTLKGIFIKDMLELMGSESDEIVKRALIYGVCALDGEEISI